MTFAEYLPPRGGFIITVPHDFTGDIDGIRDYVAEHLAARLGEPVTVCVERDPPPPGEHEPRVTVTSGRGVAIAAMMDGRSIASAWMPRRRPRARQAWRLLLRRPDHELPRDYLGP
jgi:hypothetical protein